MIKSNFVAIGVPEGDAARMAEWALEAKSRSNSGEYARREEEGIPFTVQMGDGKMFALLKGKVDTPECPKLKERGSTKVVKKAMEIESGKIFAQLIFNKSSKEIVEGELKLQEHFSGIEVVTSLPYDEKYSAIVPLAIGNGEKIRELYSKKESLSLFLQLGQTVQKMHSEGIVHRDIKPKNILLFEGGIAKLSDFGLAGSAKVYSFAGTKFFQHPKIVFLGKETDPKKADLWSFAITLFEILHPGDIPPIKPNAFIKDVIVQLYQKIVLRMQESNEGIYRLILGMLVGALEMDAIHKQMRWSITPIQTIDQFVIEIEKIVKKE